MLTSEQKRKFGDDGFVVLAGLLDAAELAVLQAETRRIFDQTRTEVLRTDEGEPRGAFAMQEYSEPFRRLLGNPKLYALALEVLGTPFYCHQYKIMCKQPFGTANHPWHQDYGTWSEIDGMPAPRAITVGVYLEEVTEFNGPLVFIPGSHRRGLLKGRVEMRPGRKSRSIMLDQTELGEIYASHGAVAPKGPAGTAILFDSLIVHGSSPNMSPAWRHIVYISPNPLDNHLVSPTRETMLASRDFSPMQPRAAIR